jgi:hypothetical protein
LAGPSPLRGQLEPLHALGYHTFPFEAFDSDGNLDVGAMPAMPANMQAALASVQGTSIWSEMCFRLRALADAPWQCDELMIHYRTAPPAGIYLMPFASLGSVDSVEHAQERTLSLGRLVLPAIQELFGTPVKIEQGWIDGLTSLLNFLKQAVGGGGSGGGGNAPVPTTGDAAVASPWAVSAGLGVDVMIALLKAAGSLFASAQTVVGTWVWYVPSDSPSFPPGQSLWQLANTWSDLAPGYGPQGNVREVNAIWDPAQKQVLAWGGPYEWDHGGTQPELMPDDLTLAFGGNPPSGTTHTEVLDNGARITSLVEKDSATPRTSAGEA